MLAEAQEIPETALFVRTDKGIRQESDIKGKIIGYLPGTVSYLYLVRLLDKLHLSLKAFSLFRFRPHYATGVAGRRDSMASLCGSHGAIRRLKRWRKSRSPT